MKNEKKYGSDAAGAAEFGKKYINNNKRMTYMNIRKRMALKTMALIAALWLAGAAGALAQSNNGNDSNSNTEQTGTGEDIGNNNGQDSPVEGGGDSDTPGWENTEKITRFVNLQSACENGSGNHATLYKIMSDISDNDYIIVTTNTTIDLNGHSITFSGDKVFNLHEDVTLTLIDNSSGSSKGSVICSNTNGGTAIYLPTDSKLIADGINITCENGKAINSELGTVEITNCNVSGKVGIHNSGTMTINGGSISGSEVALQNSTGTIAVNTGENPAACTISGGNIGIDNGKISTITLGSGVTIKDYTDSGIKYFGGTVTLNAWPTFSPAGNATGSDIRLFQGEKIAIGADITAAPTKKIGVQVVDKYVADITDKDLPYTFTSGYAAHVKSDATTVIDPAEVFTYVGSTAGIAVEFGTGDDSGEAALVKSATIPNSIVLDTNILPTYIGASGPEWTFTMPDYDVTVEVVYVDADDEVTFDFAENQEWMTWCSDKSYAKPAGVSAYTISAVTPTEVTLSEISASDGGGTAVLPAYTPLLLKKEGTGSQSIAAEATDGDTGTGIADAKGVVTQTVSGATVFGSTASLDATAFRDYLDTGSTYMLKSGAFILIDTNAGMAANRCWLTLNGTAGARSLRIGRGVSTDISGVKEMSPAGDDAWYTLTGRKMEQRPRTSGVYIHGGKKIIVK